MFAVLAVVSAVDLDAAETKHKKMKYVVHYQPAQYEAAYPAQYEAAAPAAYPVQYEAAAPAYEPEYPVQYEAAAPAAAYAAEYPSYPAPVYSAPVAIKMKSKGKAKGKGHGVSHGYGMSQGY